MVAYMQWAFFSDKACEDYRAAESIDLEHDQTSRAQGDQITVPALRVLWGSKGVIPKYGDILAVWKSYSSTETQVSGHAVDSGHYIPEEVPEKLLEEILDFMA